MGTVYAFFADGFEEIEAFTAIDTLRRAGLNVEIVSVTPDEIVVGAHDVSVLCDVNFVNCDFFDAELLLLPGGMPGASTLDKHEGLRKLILDFAEKNKPIAAICAAPMVLGKLGLLKGRKATCYPSFEQYLEGAECLDEPVVLLSKGEVDSKKIRVEFSLEDMDMSEFQDGATYTQIKDYVLEHSGLKVSNLYISQIKRKCGIEVGKNYNLPKSEDSRQPQCPPEKEKAIREAFKYFGMI